ncbi:hypothetical protein KSC_095670 [Ktedonobacter sp. SOSP1-52]|uniref:hypothetical protein n=1 Tax=Ktedonobacter sp. SOSP1-52 TaxID=2778366 RepID=UPI0019157CC4|nr:hypothetical protein [Ktedonobacter sp. SOSP1-52]GHO70675.1 hypothetical protein KSC_095670 [Ktedonobacter sp. SOSP1-52]
MRDKPSPDASQPSFFKRLQMLAGKGAKVFPIAFLVLSAIAFIVATLVVSNDYDPLTVHVDSSALLRIALFCPLVIAVGMVLVLGRRRFSVLRLNYWQIFLIVLGAGLGLYLSYQHILYHRVCCDIVYTEARGYPLGASIFSWEPTHSPPYSWNEIDALIGQHSGQVGQVIDWPTIFANGMFYANATLILVVTLRCMLYLPGRFIGRKKARVSLQRT